MHWCAAGPRRHSRNTHACRYWRSPRSFSPRVLMRPESVRQASVGVAPFHVAVFRRLDRVLATRGHEGLHLPAADVRSTARCRMAGDRVLASRRCAHVAGRLSSLRSIAPLSDRARIGAVAVVCSRRGSARRAAHGAIHLRRAAHGRGRGESRACMTGQRALGGGSVCQRGELARTAFAMRSQCVASLPVNLKWNCVALRSSRTSTPSGPAS